MLITVIMQVASDVAIRSVGEKSFTFAIIINRRIGFKAVVTAQMSTSGS
jgi:hypothetical protein